jgi:hypothetical protein
MEIVADYGIQSLAVALEPPSLAWQDIHYRNHRANC